MVLEGHGDQPVLSGQQGEAASTGAEEAVVSSAGSCTGVPLGQGQGM